MSNLNKMEPNSIQEVPAVISDLPRDYGVSIEFKPDFERCSFDIENLTKDEALRIINVISHKIELIELPEQTGFCSIYMVSGSVSLAYSFKMVSE